MSQSGPGATLPPRAELWREAQSPWNSLRTRGLLRTSLLAHFSDTNLKPKTSLMYLTLGDCQQGQEEHLLRSECGLSGKEVGKQCRPRGSAEVGRSPGKQTRVQGREARNLHLDSKSKNHGHRAVTAKFGHGSAEHWPAESLMAGLDLSLTSENSLTGCQLNFSL